jgi:heme O synthase-like polyprenyltransferase
MLGWALALIPVTLIPWLAGALGSLYAGVALVGGAAFVASILHAMRRANDAGDRRVFVVSIAYLAILFTAILVETLPT